MVCISSAYLQHSTKWTQSHRLNPSIKKTHFAHKLCVPSLNTLDTRRAVSSVFSVRHAHKLHVLPFDYRGSNDKEVRSVIAQAVCFTSSQIIIACYNSALPKYACMPTTHM